MLRTIKAVQQPHVIALLDVDGVLSPYGTANSAFDDWADPTHADVPISLSKTMANGLWDTGISIEWLTSWGDGANRIIGRHFNWPDLVVWGRTQTPGGFRINAEHQLGWWKWRWAALRSRSGEPFVWIDDELDERRAGDGRIDQWSAGLRQPHLLISPQPSIGLTPDHIDQIREFVHQHGGGPT